MGDFMPSTFTQEVAASRRFEFGRNWARFLKNLNEERITLARCSLCSMLGTDSLADKTFPDAGSGSGLFSLAARQLGAQLRSFDYDPVPVVTTRVGGAPEALEDNHTGWVLGSDKPERAAVEIASLLKNDIWLQAAAKAGPEFVKSRFGLERMLDETVQLYECPP